MMNLFNNLFVLELANNHKGDLEKGKRIIAEFSKLAQKYPDIKAAIKLQFRDCETFIHKDYKSDFSNPYIKRVVDTKLDFKSYEILVNFIKEQGLIAISTPFDEKSAVFCKLVDIIKIASSDINDWPLLAEVLKLNKPIIISSGGASDDKIDAALDFLHQNSCQENNKPIAINHCVSIYPSEKSEMNLARISYLKNRYKDYAIGFSTHEYNENIEQSFLMAYAMGAVTFERHIDTDNDRLKYCSNTFEIEKIFKVLYSAKELMFGSGGKPEFSYNEKEQSYVKSRYRGYYAKSDLKKGQTITKDDVYLAIPAQDGQLTFNDKIDATNLILKSDIKKDDPIKKSLFDGHFE